MYDSWYMVMLLTYVFGLGMPALLNRISRGVFTSTSI